jgi:hypothetical protein
MKKKEEAYIQIRIKREEPFEYEGMEFAISIVIRDKKAKKNWAIAGNDLYEVGSGGQIPVACKFKIPKEFIDKTNLGDEIEAAVYKYGKIRSDVIKITKKRKAGGKR